MLLSELRCCQSNAVVRVTPSYGVKLTLLSFKFDIKWRRSLFPVFVEEITCVPSYFVFCSTKMEHQIMLQSVCSREIVFVLSWNPSKLTLISFNLIRFVFLVLTKTSV